MVSKEELKKLTVKALRLRIKKHNIQGYTSMKKADLITNIMLKENPPAFTSRAPPPSFESLGIKKVKKTVDISDAKKDNVLVKKADFEMHSDLSQINPARMLKMREVLGKSKFDSNLKSRLIKLKKRRKKYDKYRLRALGNGWFTGREWTRLIKDVDEVDKVYRKNLKLKDIQKKGKSLKGIRIPSAEKAKLDTLWKSFRAISKDEDEDDKASVNRVDKAFTKACDHLSIARSTVSHHMKELENAGLISMTRNGQSFICKINMDAIKAIQQFLR